MRLVPCLLLIYFNAAADVTQHPNWHLLDHEECGEGFSDRIIGGTKATIGQFPWMVQIGYNQRQRYLLRPIFKCGGSLINNMYVVTAAHCVTNLPDEQQVAMLRLGEYNTQTEIDCQRGFCAPPVQDFAPTVVIIHREFNHPRMGNDIALIRLDRPAIINSFVVPICLPYNFLLSKNYVDSTMEVAGWGINNVHRNTFSPTLLYVKIPILNQNVCREHFGKNITIGPGQLCAGGQIGYDSCRGDSGGPLMKAEAVDGPPKYYLSGIVSFGPKKCGVTTPATYTNVPAYMEWILNNIDP